MDDLGCDFDALLHLEEDFYRDGEKEGVEAGIKQGNKEGFVFGLTYGAEIGCEIGYYEGFCRCWVHILKENEGYVKGRERALKLLNQLLEIVQSIKMSNNSETEVDSDYAPKKLIEKARAKSRHINALLKGWVAERAEVVNEDVSF
eukprot:Nk52_evm15s1129 gene=Nk52_evmTU15s1129